MKYTTIILFVAALLTTCSSCVTTNIGLRKIKADTNKATMQVLFFTSDNCPPCLRMKKNVWPNAEVQKSVKQYHCSPRILNSSNEKNMVYFKHYNIQYVPTTIICDRYGGELKRKVGYISIKEILHFLVR